MKPVLLPTSFLTLLGAGLGLSTQEHPSEASAIVAEHRPEVQRTAAGRLSAASNFLASLDEAQRSRCVLPLDDPARSDWTNVPPGAKEPGLKLGELTDVQVRLALDLLASGLSEEGYGFARDVMLADDLLLRGRPRTGFGAEEYWIGVFGEPSAEELWALQFDGHHLAYNLAFAGERTTMSPSFLGTQPSRFARGEDTVRPLSAEVDAAFALVNALTEEQRAQAVVGARRGRLVSGPGADGRVPDRMGLSCAELDEAQRGLLLALCRAYVDALPEADAARRMAQLEGEVARMHFAWRGPLENPSDVSYRLQGPTLLVEYACQDLGGNPLDHLHAMYRDPTNEYGAGFEAEDE